MMPMAGKKKAMMKGKKHMMPGMPMMNGEGDGAQVKSGRKIVWRKKAK